MGIARCLARLAYGALRGARNLIVASLLLVAPLSAAPITIAALGDSLTQGYGLPPEDGFVPQLEAWLRDHGADVVLTNAGVSGDTTAGGLSRVDWTLTPDVDAMIVALGGNDLLRGIDPAVARANLKGILEAAKAAGVPVLLAGMPVPGNYGPDYKAAFEAIYPDLAAEYGAILVPNFLEPITERAANGAPVGTLMQADELHPSAAGAKLIVEALGPRVLELIGRVRAGE
jgi:acyl-CoA thioesterase-1